MISTSVAGQISSDSSNVVELVTALISKQDNMWIDVQWQGESDVPEDHDKHQDWGQLDVFRLCSLHQRLQRQKDWEEKVNLSRFSQFGIMSQATLSKYSSWHTGHLHSSCYFKVSNSLLFFASHSQNIFRECSSPGPHFIRWKIHRTFFGEKDTNRFDNRLSLSASSQLVLESAFWLRWNPNWLSSLVCFLS